MREIKFRFWNKKIGMSEIVELGFAHGLRLIPSDIDKGRNDLSDDQWKIMQFTGLKDKRGKDIYEGDLVKIKNLKTVWKHGEPPFDWRIFAIEYNKYVWAFNNSVLYMPMSTYRDRDGEFYDYDIELIGNIYENSNLLK